VAAQVAPELFQLLAIDHSAVTILAQDLHGGILSGVQPEVGESTMPAPDRTNQTKFVELALHAIDTDIFIPSDRSPLERARSRECGARTAILQS